MTALAKLHPGGMFVPLSSYLAGLQQLVIAFKHTRIQMHCAPCKEVTRKQLYTFLRRGIEMQAVLETESASNRVLS